VLGCLDKISYIKTCFSVEGTAGVKRHSDHAAFCDPPVLDLQPVKYTRQYDDSANTFDIDLRSHRRLLDRTRDLPVKDILREELRPLAGSFDIELSLHHQNSVRHRDNRVSQHVEQSSDTLHFKQRSHRVNDQIGVSRHLQSSVTQPIDALRPLVNGSLDNERLLIVTDSQDFGQLPDKEVSHTARLSKVRKRTGNDAADSTRNCYDNHGPHKLSRIDRLNQRQPGLC